MNAQPKVIIPEQIADVIAAKFKAKDEITCYVGSNLVSLLGKDRKYEPDVALLKGLRSMVFSAL